MKLIKINVRFTLLILLLAGNCEAKEGIDSESSSALKNVLEANQSINDFLVTNEKSLPDLNNLAKVIATSKKTAKNNEVKSSLEKMEKAIKEIGQNPNRENFFKGFSKFSEELAEIAKKTKIDPSFNRFFCPMVSKTWVAKGAQIKNPYAADMRDCGELVK